MPLWILASIAVAFFLRAARDLLIPIALAVLASYALEPLVAWLARHRVPRLAGATIVMLAVLGTSGAAGYALRDGAMQGPTPGGVIRGPQRVEMAMAAE